MLLLIMYNTKDKDIVLTVLKNVSSFQYTMKYITCVINLILIK